MRKLINVIITSSIMIVVIILLRKLFESRVKSGAICVLWALVAIRLLIPVQLFGNVVNVTDYLTENVMNLQGRDITTEVQENRTVYRIHRLVMIRRQEAVHSRTVICRQQIMHRRMVIYR